jgi:hypothetical protein
MQTMKVNSQALRWLAEAFLDEVAEGEDIPEGEREEFATSLVRQWLTYDGSAAVFLGEEQVYAVLGRTPLGRPCVLPEPAGSGWVRRLTRDWKVSPDDLPEVLDQLNRGQSAEVVNGAGVPLRLWVNPRERSKGVEPLVKADIPGGVKRDYFQIAADELEQQLDMALEADEVEALARSVAKQWQRYEGHACLFLDGHRQLVLKLDEHGDGTCEVAATRRSVALERALPSLGLPPEVLPELIARFNLGQEIGFRDGNGVQARLWYDPKARGIWVRPLDPVLPAVAGEAPPILCPNCTAVLRPWRDGERHQTCPLCGQTISLDPVWPRVLGGKT